MNGQYEVLSPWAEVEPVPLKGISPRVTDLSDKTVGFFAIVYKKTARPILTVVERELKERFPNLKSSWFLNPYSLVVADVERAGDKHAIPPELKAEFEEWVKGVDAVVSAVGD